MLFERGARSTTPTLKEPVGVQLKLVGVAAGRISFQFHQVP